MLVLPLVGWGMLSAARYPIVLFGAVHLPSSCRMMLCCMRFCGLRTPSLHTSFS